MSMTYMQFKAYDPHATRDEHSLECLVNDELRNEVCRIQLEHERQKGKERGADAPQIWLQVWTNLRCLCANDRTDRYRNGGFNRDASEDHKQE